MSDRLKVVSRQTGESYPDLYRRVAIDRLLARVDWSKWTAKGGYILQRRLEHARRTKDLDLAFRDAKALLSDQHKRQLACLEALQAIASVDAEDYFVFQVRLDHPLDGFGKGGVRCQVRCLVDGMVWADFQVDVVIQDETVFPAEVIFGDPFLSFAGLERLSLKVPIQEEVFAEKIHAYTLPRERENTRVKDLVDLALLIKDGLDVDKTRTALLGVTSIRNTHQLTKQLQPPPANWQTSFEELVRDTGIDLSMREAFDLLNSFYASLKLEQVL